MGIHENTSTEHFQKDVSRKDLILPIIATIKVWQSVGRISMLTSVVSKKDTRLFFSLV